MLVHISPATAQVSAPPIPKDVNSNSVGVGISAGTVVERDANFWGFTLDYARRTSDRLVISGSVTWDRETETFTSKPDNTVNT